MRNTSSNSRGVGKEIYHSPILYGKRAIVKKGARMDKKEWSKKVKKELIERDMDLYDLAEKCDYSYDAIRKTVNLQAPYDRPNYDRPRSAICKVLGIESWSD